MAKELFSFSPQSLFNFIQDVCMLEQIESLSEFWSRIAISRAKAEYDSATFYE